MMENQIKSKVKQIKIAMKSNMNSLLIKKCRTIKSKIKQTLFKIKINKELLKSRLKHVLPKMLIKLYQRVNMQSYNKKRYN